MPHGKREQYLANHIAVSFEGEFIKVVNASTRSNLTIHQALTLRDEEFDIFLRNEKTRHFTVVSDFKASYHDILFLPPAKDKYLKKLVESEVRKRAPELQDFSFFYLVLGEAVREGKRGKDVFAFAVSNAELFQIVNRFSRHNKIVRHIYPGVFVLSRLVYSSVEMTDEPLLCVMESGLSKTLFLVKEGKPYFVRAAQSHESGLHDLDLDVHDINMTVNYCRQTLKLMPSQIVLLGNAYKKYETAADFTVPAVCMKAPYNVRAPKEWDVMDFIVPLSSLIPDKELGAANILPQSYRFFIFQKSILTYLMMLFLILSGLGIGYMKARVSDLSKTRGAIDLLRAEIRHMEPSLPRYEAGSREVHKLMPLISFIKR